MVLKSVLSLSLSHTSPRRAGLSTEMQRLVNNAETFIKQVLPIGGKMTLSHLVETLEHKIVAEAVRRAVDGLVQKREFEYRLKRRFIFRVL